MKRYRQFLACGLLLGLFTEFQLKIIAGMHRRDFLIAIFVYPLLVTAAYCISNALDRRLTSTWQADLAHYLVTGVFGLGFEWLLLGNGPGSHANQPGMFAMWTTFCFGPRVLTRTAAPRMRCAFWVAFGVVAVLLTIGALLLSTPQARFVVVVLGLIGTYLLWSLWLLLIAWLSRESPRH